MENFKPKSKSENFIFMLCVINFCIVLYGCSVNIEAENIVPFHWTKDVSEKTFYVTSTYSKQVERKTTFELPIPVFPTKKKTLSLIDELKVEDNDDSYSKIMPQKNNDPKDFSDIEELLDDGKSVLNDDKQEYSFEEIEEENLLESDKSLSIIEVDDTSIELDIKSESHKDPSLSYIEEDAYSFLKENYENDNSTTKKTNLSSLLKKLRAKYSKDSTENSRSFSNSKDNINKEEKRKSGQLKNDSIKMMTRITTVINNIKSYTHLSKEEYDNICTKLSKVVDDTSSLDDSKVSLLISSTLELLEQVVQDRK